MMALVGGVLQRCVEDAGGVVLLRSEAKLVSREGDGGWITHVRSAATGATSRLTSRSVLVATGGHQDGAALWSAEVAGRPLLPRCAGRLVLSDDVLAHGGVADVGRRLQGLARPRVVVVGGGTSGLAATVRLLEDLPDALSAPGSVTVLHRRPLRVFYPSQAAALADGCEFGPEDVCPVSGYVFRLAGFRLASRDLLVRLKGVAGAPPEPRVNLHDMRGATPEATWQIIDRADVVVCATGYVPRLVPVVDARGRPLPLAGEVRGARAVDDACRVLDAEGTPVPDVLGLGLAMGFVPSGRFGGEPSFRGQANGLWLWQTGVGAMVVDHVTGRSDARATSLLGTSH